MTHTFASVNKAKISSDYGLSPVRRQAIIISTNFWLFVNWTLGIKLQRNFNQNTVMLIQASAFENVVCKMAAMLSRLQCVNCYVK